MLVPQSKRRSKLEQELSSQSKASRCSPHTGTDKFGTLPPGTGNLSKMCQVCANVAQGYRDDTIYQSFRHVVLRGENETVDGVFVHNKGIS